MDKASRPQRLVWPGHGHLVFGRGARQQNSRALSTGISKSDNSDQLARLLPAPAAGRAATLGAASLSCLGSGGTFMCGVRLKLKLRAELSHFDFRIL